MKPSVVIFQVFLWCLMWLVFVEHSPFWLPVLKVVAIALMLAGLTIAVSRVNHQNLAKQRVQENASRNTRMLRGVSTASWMWAMWLGFMLNDMWTWGMFWTFNMLAVIYAHNQIAVREYKLRSGG